MRLRRRALCGASATFTSTAVPEPARDGVVAPPVEDRSGTAPPWHAGPAPADVARRYRACRRSGVVGSADPVRWSCSWAERPEEPLTCGSPCPIACTTRRWPSSSSALSLPRADISC